MTNQPAFAGGDPHQLLAGSRALAHRVRADQRATWFPLLVFAAVCFAAVPVDRYSHYARSCRANPPAGRVCTVYSTAGFVYWPIALVLAYVAIAAFYLHLARVRGLGTRIRPYVVGGIVIAVVLTCASIWAAHHPVIGSRVIPGLHLQPQSWDAFYRIVGPASAIGIALLVLAWVERSRALLVLTLGYLAIVLVPIDFGWAVVRPSRWAFLPHLVIAGTVLLLGGVGFALAQRPAHRPARRPAG